MYWNNPLSALSEEICFLGFQIILPVNSLNHWYLFVSHGKFIFIVIKSMSFLVTCCVLKKLLVPHPSRYQAIFHSAISEYNVQ